MATVLEVEVTRTRLEAAIAELTYLLYRSAYSTLMRESRDCSIFLLSPKGDIVVNGLTHGHRMNYHHFIRVLLERFPDMAPGDIYLSNHPYEASIPHTPDLGVVVPAFCDGVLVGFGCSIAHKPDFGGSVVGSASMGATHLFQEGLLLPPLRYRRDGVVNEVVDQVISANVRNPDLFFGDMRAQLGVTQVGAERITAIARQFGINTLLEVYDELMDQGERNLRRCLTSWPDGSVSVEGFMDNDGVDLERPVRLALSVTVSGDEIIFDTTGSDDQTVGPVNMTIPYVEAGIFFALIALADPDFGFNDGMRRPVRLVSRRGSVLDPVSPAPVGAATSVNHRFVDLCFEALGQFIPERSIAHSGGSGGTLAFNWQTDLLGARALQYEVLGSAMGAMAERDGVSGVAVYATNLAITSVEILESQFPMRVRRFELIKDSGGPGRTRGGLSYRREYEAVNAATVSRRAERGRFPGRGVAGGLPGSVARVTLGRGEGDFPLPVAGQYQVAPGEIFRVEGAGGGGMGDPRTREPELVALDVRRGYVSRDSARELYAVVLDEELDVDAGATTRLRGRRS
ncbi:MAG TPA: hydantoinase B/oxoprolinase family protein [Acidimicrobiales bacterium]|nr:hydantoinase B/oxoprolinase family protein [Acidimicrobiales bacterium]